MGGKLGKRMKEKRAGQGEGPTSVPHSRNLERTRPPPEEPQWGWHFGLTHREGAENVSLRFLFWGSDRHEPRRLEKRFPA